MVEEISRNFDCQSKLSDWSDSCQELSPTSLITRYRCGLVFQQELWEAKLGEHELKSYFTKIMEVLNEDHCVLLKTIC